MPYVCAALSLLLLLPQSFAGSLSLAGTVEPRATISFAEAQAALRGNDPRALEARSNFRGLKVARVAGPRGPVVEIKAP